MRSCVGPLILSAARTPYKSMMIFEACMSRAVMNLLCKQDAIEMTCVNNFYLGK